MKNIFVAIVDKCLAAAIIFDQFICGRFQLATDFLDKYTGRCFADYALVCVGAYGVVNGYNTILAKEYVGFACVVSVVLIMPLSIIQLKQLVKDGVANPQRYSFLMFTIRFAYGLFLVVVMIKPSLNTIAVMCFYSTLYFMTCMRMPGIKRFEWKKLFKKSPKLKLATQEN